MPLKYNPFRPNNLIHPGMFKGRTKELLAIEKAIFQTKHGNPHHFIIEGERGIGKSSLMFYVEGLAKGELPLINAPELILNFLVVSIELTSDTAYLDLIKKIAEGIKLRVAERESLKAKAKGVWDFLSNWEILGVKYNKPDEIDPLLMLDKLCEQIAELIRLGEADKEDPIDGIMVLIDEADKPSEAARLGEFVKLFTEKMTRLHCEKLAIGLAGLPTLLEKLKATHESSPRLFTIYTLGPLSSGDCSAVIQSGLNEANLKNSRATAINLDAQNLLCELSEGYPHFIQQFSYSAFEQDTDSTISKDDVTHGAYDKGGALEQLGRKFFQQQYFDQIGSEDYRKVLRAMADNLDDWMSRSELLKATNLKPHTVTNALQALKTKGIISASERQKGMYRLPTKSFAAWIKAFSQAPEDLKIKLEK